MKIRYLSLALASVLALSGCGSDDSGSGVSSTPPKEVVDKTPQRQEPESFAGSYSGIINSDLKDIYNTSLSMSTIVNNDGEFWMVYTNNGFIYNPNNLVFGLVNGKFKKSDNPNVTSLSSNATDYSFTSNSISRRLIDLDPMPYSGADFTFFETVVYEDEFNPEGFEEELRYPVFLNYDQGNFKDQLKDYKGVYQGALVTTSTRSTASMVTNDISKGKMGYSIVDEHGCIIAGNITFDPKSIYLRVDGNVDNSAATCFLESGKVHGLVSKDDEKSKVLMLVNDDNEEAYVFSVIS